MVWYNSLKRQKVAAIANGTAAEQNKTKRQAEDPTLLIAAFAKNGEGDDDDDDGDMKPAAKNPPGHVPDRWNGDEVPDSALNGWGGQDGIKIWLSNVTRQQSKLVVN